MGKQRQCRGDLFVFKDVFSAQFLNCQRIVKPNTDHRKIHLVIFSISISLSLFYDSLSFSFTLSAVDSVCWMDQKSSESHILYFYAWIETISVLNVNKGIWKTDTKSVAVPGRRRRQWKKTTPMREWERERESRTAWGSERDANANESNESSDEQEQQQFRGITKIKYGRIKCLCSALCALLRHLRPLLPWQPVACSRPGEGKGTGMWTSLPDRRPKTRDPSVACS